MRGLIAPLDREIREIGSLITWNMMKSEGQGVARKEKPPTRREQVADTIIPATNIPCAHDVPQGHELD
jgi:hypothetical protein